MSQDELTKFLASLNATALQQLIETATDLIDQKKAQAKQQLLEKWSAEAAAVGVNIHALLRTNKRGRPRSSHHAKNGTAA